jgi:hypothetical protein
MFSSDSTCKQFGVGRLAGGGGANQKTHMAQGRLPSVFVYPTIEKEMGAPLRF